MTIQSDNEIYLGPRKGSFKVFADILQLSRCYSFKQLSIYYAPNTTLVVRRSKMKRHDLYS